MQFSIGLEPLVIFFAVFCRVAGMFAMMPGFAENYIPIQYRVALALLLALMIVDFIDVRVQMTDISIISLVFAESLTGLTIGLCARFIVYALHTFGIVVSMMSGLSVTPIFDPAQSTQTSAIGQLATYAAVAMIFITDLHLQIVWSLIYSYEKISFGYFVVESLTESIVLAASKSFQVGIQLAAPFIAVGSAMYLTFGILSRLMPQLQVFFLMVPLQVSIALFLLILTLVGIISSFLIIYHDYLTDLLVH